MKKVLFEDIGYDLSRNINVYACICPSCGQRLDWGDYDNEYKTVYCP